jgi:hypothetical protein
MGILHTRIVEGADNVTLNESDTTNVIVTGIAVRNLTIQCSSQSDGKA